MCPLPTPEEMQKNITTMKKKYDDGWEFDEALRSLRAAASLPEKASRGVAVDSGCSGSGFDPRDKK